MFILSHSQLMASQRIERGPYALCGWGTSFKPPFSISSSISLMGNYIEGMKFDRKELSYFLFSSDQYDEQFRLLQYEKNDTNRRLYRKIAIARGLFLTHFFLMRDYPYQRSLKLQEKLLRRIRPPEQKGLSNDFADNELERYFQDRAKLALQKSYLWEITRDYKILDIAFDMLRDDIKEIKSIIKILLDQMSSPSVSFEQKSKSFMARLSLGELLQYEISYFNRLQVNRVPAGDTIRIMDFMFDYEDTKYKDLYPKNFLVNGTIMGGNQGVDVSYTLMELEYLIINLRRTTKVTDNTRDTLQQIDNLYKKIQKICAPHDLKKVDLEIAKTLFHLYSLVQGYSEKSRRERTRLKSKAGKIFSQLVKYYRPDDNRYLWAKVNSYQICLNQKSRNQKKNKGSAIHQFKFENRQRLITSQFSEKDHVFLNNLNCK